MLAHSWDCYYFCPIAQQDVSKGLERRVLTEKEHVPFNSTP